MTVDDRRDDIHAMIGSHGLLRRVHDDSLAPATRPPEVIVTTSSDPPAPEAGDPAGYDAYQTACSEISHVWRHGMTAIGARILPRYVAEGRIPTPYEADQATRALLVWLDELADLKTGERADGKGPRHRGGVLLAVKRAREALDAAAGANQRPEPPMCDNCRVSYAGAGKSYELESVCWHCANHRKDYGQWPDYAHSA